MKMYKNMKNANNLLVMVPHLEIRQKMRDFSAELVSSGLEGAWSFPHVIPLAITHEALNGSELKQCAAAIRLCNSNTDKFVIKCKKPEYAEYPQIAPVFVFGPELDINMPDSVFSDFSDKILFRFSH